MITRLKEDHNRLREIADRLEAHLEADAPPQGADFPQLRWMLVRELSMHLAVERRAIEEWNAATRTPGETPDHALDDAFMQHVATWSGATVSAAWNRYRTETRSLLDRLRARMTAEELHLFPSFKAAPAG